jgi:hypothetical protein
MWILKNRWLFLLSLLSGWTLWVGCTCEPCPNPRADEIYVDDLGDGVVGDGSEDPPSRSLQDAIDGATDAQTIRVAAGIHEANATEAVDPTCGNCADEDYRVDVPITVGFTVVGKSVHIVGASAEQTVLQTGAGYGLYFERAGQSTVEDLTVTGGVRDADGRATDAAIVVRYTDLTVRNVDIIDNNDLYTGDPDPVVGIMGIAGREGADITVLQSRVLNSSWDGITLYRSDPEVGGSEARALVIDTLVGCTEDCVSTAGRGVGIASTWDSSLEVSNSEVHHYWKGIGTFGNSTALLTNNLVRDQHGWGLIISGESTATVHNNVIANNGTTGMAAWSEDISASFVNNIVTGNGWNPDEWVGKRTGFWLNADVEFSWNDVWDNQVSDVCTGYPTCSPVAFEGLDGNLSVDPDYADGSAGSISPSSPVVDLGEPEILDVDGTRSDMGLGGGPGAGRTRR